MATSTVLTNKPINPRGDDNRPVDGYNRASLYSGKVLDFDGTNDQVEVTTSEVDFGADSFTVSAIVDWSGSHGDGKLAYAERGSANSQLAAWQIRTDGSGNMLFQANTAADGWQAVTFSGVEAIIADGLTHLTFVRVGTGATLYINGQFYSNGTGSIQATLDAANGNFCIGNRLGVSNYWNGKIGQYKIFSGALTAAQVSDLYNNPEKIVPTGVSNTALKLWLPMMEGTGTTAYDGSGNGNHGTISGGTYIHGVGAPVAQSAVMDWNKGTNIFQHSEEFNDSYWVKARVLITANDITAPDGQITADKALENSTTGYRDFGYRAIAVTSGQPYTLSAYVKNGLGRDNAYLYTADGARMAKFNIATGTYIGYASGNGYNAWDSYGITDAGNGWYRIHATLNSSIGGSKNYHLGFAENTDDFVTPYTGDTSKGLYAWGMQLEQTASVGPYVRTGDTNQTSPVLLPQGLTSGRDITGVNLFENVRKQGALNLDGNSWAEVHDNASLDVTTGVTAEAWVYWVSPSASKGILAKWGSSSALYAWLFQARSNSAIRLYIYDGTNYLVESSTLTEGWRHLCATYDGVTLRMYVDGQADTTTAHTGSIPSVEEPVKIGAYGAVTSTTYEHDIAQPRIYNRALTASEVLNNYNATKTQYQ